MFVRRLMTAVVVCLLSLGVVSCAEEKPTPRFAEPTSAAPSPTEAESAPPERESAEDFIRRWVALSNDMQSTGDTSAFLRVSRSCADCRTFASSVEQVYADGGSIDFAGSTIAKLRRAANGVRDYELDLATPETIIRGPSGSVDSRMPAGVGRYLISLHEDRGRWLVTNMGRR